MASNIIGLFLFHGTPISRAFHPASHSLQSMVTVMVIATIIAPRLPSIARLICMRTHRACRGVRLLSIHKLRLLVPALILRHRHTVTLLLCVLLSIRPQRKCAECALPLQPLATPLISPDILKFRLTRFRKRIEFASLSQVPRAEDGLVILLMSEPHC